VIEHLHAVNRCRALFATHYHELTALAAQLSDLACYTMRVKEWQGDVVFLHEVAAGAADRSYGIQVAKLAGLPASVIERAKEVLAKLEQEDRAAPKGFEDLPLFAAPCKPSAALPGAAHELIAAAVAALNPDDMSPREAMEALYSLKEQLTKPRKEP
jgi:DNA mismatch repair protein MutS